MQRLRSRKSAVSRNQRSLARTQFIRRNRGSTVRNPITTFLQLYASPNAFRAAAAKAMRLVREVGLSGLREAVRWKVAYPSLPLEVLQADPARLSFEDRWVTQGEGLTRLHAVGIIILTKGNRSLLGACLTSLARSILKDARVEILVFNNGRPMAPPHDSPFPVRGFHETRRFNWAAGNNRAVEYADCEFLLFLNDDVEALHGGWLDAMLAEAIKPQVGAVAPKLLYPNGTIQHCGIVLGQYGYGEHVYKFRPRDYPGEKGECLRPRQVTAITGACLLTGKETFKRLGGFDERFPLNYNDVDYCLRLTKSGKQVIVTPYAELIHRETATRSFRTLRREKLLFQLKRDGQ